MYIGDKEITGIYLGDKEITGSYIGSEELWVCAKPFTLSFLDYPLTTTHLNGDNDYKATTAAYYEVWACKNSGSGSYGTHTVNTPKIPTQGCNKVRVTYTASDWSHATINGKSVTWGQNNSAVSGTLTFDVTDDTFVLSLNVTDATSYSRWLRVTKVEFYRE